MRSMKLYVIDRKPSKIRLNVIDLEKQLEKNGFKFKNLDADSVEGISFNQLYDLVDFPSVVITRDDGQLVQRWQTNLPTYNDLIAHLQEI